MKYKVHQLEIKLKSDKDKLENFLNNLKGEVITIIPNVRPVFQGMGATAKIDFLLIVEKVN